MIPDIQLHNIMKSCLSALRSDFKANSSNESETILYYLLNSNEVEDTGKFNWYSQAVEIFINRDKDHPKFLDTRLFFDRERAAIPTIHIMLSGESKGHDGMGFDLGYKPEQVIGDSQRSVFNRQFDINANIIVTSDNTFETVIIYTVMKAMMISIVNHIMMKGFINPVISGRDITLSQEIAPNGIFARTINFSAGYEQSVPEVVLNKIVSSVWMEMSSVNNNPIDPGSISTGKIDPDDSPDSGGNDLPGN